MEYWQDCVKRHVNYLKEAKSEDLLNYQLLDNDISGGIQTLCSQENYQDAILVKMQSESGAFENQTKYIKTEEKNKIHALNASLDSLKGEDIKMLKAISHKEAELYFSNSEAVLAACAELATGSIDAAVVMLIRANEIFLAYFVAKLLKANALDEINQLLGMRSERLGQIEHAAFYFKNCRNQRRMQLFVARNKLDYNKYGLQTKIDYKNYVKGAKGADAVFYNIMSEDLEQACKITIERLQSIF